MKRRFAWLAASARASASNSFVTSARTYTARATMPIIKPIPSKRYSCQKSLTMSTRPNPSTLTARQNRRYFAPNRKPLASGTQT